MRPKITTRHTKIAKGTLAGIIILAILGIIVLGFFKTTPFATGSSARITNIILDKTIARADGKESVKATIITTASNQRLWLGLKPFPANLVSQQGFYSENGRNSFRQTDSNGQAVFNIKSIVPGKITYFIYAAQTSTTGQLFLAYTGEKFQIEFR